MNHFRYTAVLVAASGAFLTGIPGEHATVDTRAAKPVTVFFVRHAETGPRPDRLLSAAGRERAGALCRLLGKAGVTHLFSSDYARTRGTLEPLAKAMGLEVQLISQAKPGPQAVAIRALPAESIAVVAGHSNTLPPLIAKLGAKVSGLTRRGFIVDDVHDRLFAMTLAGDETSMVELRYGASSSPNAAEKRAPTLKPEDVQIGAAQNDRKSSSVFFYSRTETSLDVHGQFELTYGAPAWKAEHGETLEKAKAGDRLRLGNNFFATFDTSCPVDIGGAQLSPGVYYLALERQGPNAMSIVFLDPSGIRAKKWNGNHSSETKGGITAPLLWRQTETTTERLEIAMKPEAKRGTKTALTIRFGRHELSGTLRAILD